jgi:hypothetical protein
VLRNISKGSNAYATDIFARLPLDGSRYGENRRKPEKLEQLDRVDRYTPARQVLGTRRVV